MAKRKRKSPLYIGKEFYGKIPKEKAFKDAFEPYFTKPKEIKPDKKDKK